MFNNTGARTEEQEGPKAQSLNPQPWGLTAGTRLLRRHGTPAEWYLYSNPFKQF